MCLSPLRKAGPGGWEVKRLGNSRTGNTLTFACEEAGLGGVEGRVKKVNGSRALLREKSKLIAAPTFCWRMLYLVLCWRRAERCP